MKMRITKKVEEEIEISEKVYQRLYSLIEVRGQEISREDFNKELATALNLTDFEDILEICNEGEGIFYLGENWG